MSTEPARASCELRGITWDHDRGLAPLQATAAVWQARHGVAVHWLTRSLKDFGEAPLADLAGEFDLLVVDHPFIGRAADQDLLADLHPLLSAQYWASKRDNDLGGALASYSWQGRQLALPVDAAAQVLACRPDLAAGRQLPRTWPAVLEAAGRKPGMGLPLNATDVVPTFLTLCCAAGPAVFAGSRQIPAGQGLAALSLLRSLAEVAVPWSVDCNPIQLFEAMANSDDIWFCPAAFGYVNYSQAGYREQQLAFADIPAPLVQGAHGGATMGGAGLAVSARSARPHAAAAYARYVASADVQAGVYIDSGGQPAHRAAWDSARASQQAGGFFAATRATMDAAFIRPRHPGYLDWQDGAGPLLAAFARGEGAAEVVLAELNRRYAETLPIGDEAR